MAKKTSSTSLQSLRFDPTLSDKWWAKYMKNIRIVILIILAILAIGVTSLLTLSKRLNPEVKLTIVSVVTILPGAGPIDTESLLTVPLEDKLEGIKGIDTIRSSSRDNVSVITIQFVSGIDKDKARTDVQSAVDSVTTIPSDAKTPTVTAFDFEGQPIWQFALTSTGDTSSLMRYADNLKDKIEDITDIDRVTLNGYETQQIEIKITPEKIANFGINPNAIAGALKTSTMSFPAGTLNSNGSNFSLSIDSDVNSVEDIRNLIFNISGRPIRLGDIAEISVKSLPEIQKTYLADSSNSGRRAVTFFVYKNSSADISKTVKKVEDMVGSDIESQNGKFQVNTITNTGEEINKQFTDVISEFRSTLLLVFLNLLLFLGLRQALIASITIPLTFLMAFGWMSALGQTINFISLFALLLAFGTSIDDTIVTVSAMTAYNKNKKLTTEKAGILVWRDFVTPIWTTTATTVWAFLPLILSTGIIGEFIKPIPITVATTMYSSTFVAWFITLPLMIVFLNPNIPSRVKKFMKGLLIIISILIIVAISPKNMLLIPIVLTYIFLLFVSFKFRKKMFSKRPKNVNRSKFFDKLTNSGFINLEPLENKYRDIITRIIASKRGRRLVLICLVIYSVVAYALLPLGLVKNEFFPKTNGDNIFVNVVLPAGSDNKTVEMETTRLLTELQKTEELKTVTAEVGKEIGDNGGEVNSSNSILFSIILNPKEHRKVTSTKVANDIRTKLGSYNKGKVSVVEESGGPPAGSDVQISLSGDDLEQLDIYANNLMLYLGRQPGVVNIDKSIKQGTGKLVFIPNKSRLSQVGITADSLGFWLRLNASGFTLDTLRLDAKDNDIVFYVSDNKISPEDLGRISIPTQNGNVTLMSLGKLELHNNPTEITHEAGKRIVSVSAGVLAGYSVSDANKNLINYATNNLNMKSGYEWKTGGVNEENTKSVTSIFRAMLLSFILIMATMVIEFGSFRQAAIILSLIPFAIAGVFYVFGLTGTPLSFPALIGVMALFGVVVTNAMFIVEKINQNRKSGMSINNAIADAGQSRLEPIILTSLTSILGLVPITFANALWRGLGGAIISGLLFSGLIMLFYVPVMYKSIYSDEK